MPRPTVAHERRQKIVEATLRTIASRGITGASLDRIAEEAGMSRGHVRHFVGNRDDLIVETARLFYFGDGATSILPRTVRTLEEAVDYLFGPVFTARNDANTIVFGFVEAARDNAALTQILEQAYGGSERALVDMIASEYPESPANQRESVAAGIVATALGNVFMSDIQPSIARTDAAREAALHLVSTIRNAEAASRD